ncbi:hypothetical protein Pfo_022651 [Paulownia fortunei]|nr:hypothetical protein Pfo_022651 [Paulownia fortunei]
MAIPIEVAGNVLEMQLIPFQEIREQLSRHKREVAAKHSWIHIGAIKVVVKATFKEGIDSPLNLAIFNKLITNIRDTCLGAILGNLYAGKIIFFIYPQIAYNLVDRDFGRVLTLYQDFKNQDIMKEWNRPYSITYKHGDIDEGKLRKPKMKDERKFGEALLQWRQEGECGDHSEKVTGEVLNLMKVSLTTSPQMDNDA